MNWFENWITGIGKFVEWLITLPVRWLTGWEPEAIPVWFSMGLRIIVIVAAVILIPAILFAITTWVERKVLARITNRLGPNRVGPFGLLQPVADGIKMLTKEDIVPEKADKPVHMLAPILALVPA